MALELIPAPGRQLKTWSTWIAIAGVALGIAYQVLPDFESFFEPKVFVGLMTVIAGLIKIVSLVKQAIPVTPEQKEAIVDSAISLPVIITPEEPKPLNEEKK